MQILFNYFQFIGYLLKENKCLFREQVRLELFKSIYFGFLIIILVVCGYISRNLKKRILRILVLNEDSWNNSEYLQLF